MFPTSTSMFFGVVRFTTFGPCDLDWAFEPAGRSFYIWQHNTNDEKTLWCLYSFAPPLIMQTNLSLIPSSLYPNRGWVLLICTKGGFVILERDGRKKSQAHKNMMQVDPSFFID